MEEGIDSFKMEMDPIWLEYGEEILATFNVIKNNNSSLLSLSESILDSLLTSFYSTKIEGYTNYSPLIEILKALIYLLEVQEGAKLDDTEIFSQHLEQQKLIRSFKLFVEDIYQRPDDEINESVYDKYRKVLSVLIQKLAELENMVDKQDRPLPNIVGSLIMLFKHACRKNNINLKGLNSDIISNQLSDNNNKKKVKKAYRDYIEKVAVALEALRAHPRDDKRSDLGDVQGGTNN